LDVKKISEAAGIFKKRIGEGIFRRDIVKEKLVLVIWNFWIDG